MISRFFHAWERRLASVTTDRVVREFDWGVDWLPSNGNGADKPQAELVSAWAARMLAQSDSFFATDPASDYSLDGEWVTFTSALSTPHDENNLVWGRYFPARRRRRANPVRRAVVVLPQWNSGANGHVGLCRWLAHAGISAVRLSLPYPDRRMPPELTRADYIVSSNIARTLQVCRQAVLDARRAVAWLAGRGYERIGILGTSLGSCLAMLTAAHEPRITAAALNHVSPFFADVVWHGLSTAHVRQGLNGHIGLEQLRNCWMPISPFPYLHKVAGKAVLLVYALYDLTFPVTLSRVLVDEFKTRGVEHELAVLPCGHYSSGVTPFKYVDGYLLIDFLRRRL
jgi:dienelactone hydrolase